MHKTVQINPDPLDSRQFDLVVRKLADALSYGQEASIFHGAGLEYEQSRLYTPGDSTRFIDWKVSARAGKLYVKEFEEPKRVPLYILIDTSASMCVSSTPLSKYGLGLQIATALALAAQSKMTPVGIMGCGERELHVEPTLSRNVVMDWSHQLRHHNFVETTSLGRRARELAPTLGQRNTILVVSDFHDADGIAAIRTLAQRHDCVALHMLDPAEYGVSGAGIFRGREAETGKHFVARGQVRQETATAELQSELTRFRVDYCRIQTDKPILATLRHFLKHRGGLTSGAR
jgi:uncharacterized protein (DUF58 family)